MTFANVLTGGVAAAHRAAHRVHFIPLKIKGIQVNPSESDHGSPACQPNVGRTALWPEGRSKQVKAGKTTFCPYGRSLCWKRRCGKRDREVAQTRRRDARATVKIAKRTQNRNREHIAYKHDINFSGVFVEKTNPNLAVSGVHRDAATGMWTRGRAAHVPSESDIRNKLNPSRGSAWRDCQAPCKMHL